MSEATAAEVDARGDASTIPLDKVQQQRKEKKEAKQARAAAKTAKSKEAADLTGQSTASTSNTTEGHSDAQKKIKQRGRKEDSPDVRMSKTLSYILRHGAAKEGLKMRKDGYVRVDELLRRPKLKECDLPTLKRLVAENEKQRYALLEETDPLTGEENVLFIRANQGHSLKDVDDLELEKINLVEECPVVVHGTFLRNWDVISKEGLKVMGRHHIHCASGLFGQEGVISGMRSSCDVFIYIDISKAMADGITFEKSANGVILTKGKDGVLSPTYFKEVKTKQGESLQA